MILLHDNAKEGEVIQLIPQLLNHGFSMSLPDISNINMIYMYGE